MKTMNQYVAQRVTSLTPSEELRVYPPETWSYNRNIQQLVSRVEVLKNNNPRDAKGKLPHLLGKYDALNLALPWC